tara:strand:- start:4402 stop:4845 length:444 start_codon:yes stop_codon:yes gene_type:complete
MGNIFDDLNADDQFIEADVRDEVTNEPINTDIDFCSLVVSEYANKVSLHIENDMGIPDPVGLFLPENKVDIQEAINQTLKDHPGIWIRWEHGSFKGVHFQIRRGNGVKERFFRTDTKGAFARRKIYAQRNPDSVVSFTMFPEESQTF